MLCRTVRLLSCSRSQHMELFIAFVVGFGVATAINLRHMWRLVSENAELREVTPARAPNGRFVKRGA